MPVQHVFALDEMIFLLCEVQRVGVDIVNVFCVK